MKHECKICGKDSLFFIWSTSRAFNRERYLDYYKSKHKEVSKEEETEILRGDYVVCQFCLHQKNLI
jgi:hypothetical protein